ncbi:MAG: carboxypeptidase regulatory-like domain-containing protein [Acidobacteriia bacterium]|nr:carboxypeptidase regulatory-like domain-containing protein [Terriglobia bacterium]
MLNWRKAARVTALITILAGAVGVLAAYVALHYYKKPVYLTGAVIKQDDDPMKESPITDVEVSAAEGVATNSTKSNFAGFYSLRLVRGINRNQTFTLRFRHPDYVPLDLKEQVGDRLSVVHLVPIHKDVDEKPNRPATPVTNVLIRYSIQTTTQQNIGTEAKTFQIPNSGNIPCAKSTPCSPDGKWKAASAAESLDAGEGNEFRNARVSCIAGPCPFTRVDVDGFSKGGRYIRVAVRNWSDTVTFLLQAEVFHEQIDSIVRMAFPVILGTSLNFTLPPAAQGPTVQAELNSEEIIFPLGPNPILSWANCNVSVDRNKARFYRCDLKSEYRFQESK